ncbi:MAG TPA: tyrosine-type recombinase/integrase, partial [Nakamurella sp.]|nr:tyrosine-type recombinase/integrase [Nakamurella sp.]
MLRSMCGWAYAARILDRHPLDGMRGPPHDKVRLHVPVEQARYLLSFAAQQVFAAQEVADACGGPAGDRRARSALHHAQQLLLLTRLAADSGARRGELATLQLGDLDGDVLTIARSTSNEVIGPTKSGRIRRLTLGSTTAELWRDTVRQWGGRSAGTEFGPWLFSPETDHRTRLSTSCLGHWFATLCDDAGLPDVTLHRLRHSVATALV